MACDLSAIRFIDCGSATSAVFALFMDNNAVRLPHGTINLRASSSNSICRGAPVPPDAASDPDVATVRAAQNARIRES